MLDSRVVNCSGFSPLPMHAGCISVSGGTLVLRNSMLSNCHAPAPAPPYIGFTKATVATNFRSELLALGPSCDEDPSTALIGVDEAVEVTLNVRGLRVIPPAACASSTNLSVFSDNMRPLTCSDGDDNTSVCGAAASCTNEPLLGTVRSLMTVNCSCHGDFPTNPNATRHPPRAAAAGGLQPM